MAKQALETTAVDAPAAQPDVAAKPVVKLRPVPTNRLKPAEVARNVWCLDVEPSTTIEDLKRRDFLGNLTRMLRRHDKIEVMWADGSREAVLRVLAVGPKEVAVGVLSENTHDSIDPDALSLPTGYSIEWGGDIEKHRVLRGRDVIRSGFDTKSAAQTWLSNHMQAMVR